MTETGEVLVKALEVMRERGWCKHSLQNGVGEVCAVGALGVALNREAMYAWGARGIDEALDALTRHIPADFVSDRPDSPHPVQYNNTRKDFSEVEEWFAKAIADEGYEL